MAEKVRCEDVVTLQGEVYVRKNSSAFPKESKTVKVKNVQNHPYTLGKQWFVQTATHYFVGLLSDVTEGELILQDAAWVADTGRFNEFMKSGKPGELEPCNGPVVINRGAIIASMPSPLVVIEVK